MSAREQPRMSDHAKFRFVQRAGVDTPSAAQAWRQSIPVSVEGYDYRRARYDPLREVVFLTRGGVVTTVLRAAYVEFAFTEVAR